MLSELEILEKVDHPHITRVFELLEDQRNYYVVMEYLKGGNLLDKVVAMQRFSERQVADVIHQVMLALNYMHQQNISHRDLKLENLMCLNDNLDDLTVKLTDFGFATFFDPKLKMHLGLGSPLYMSPELVMDSGYDQRVDVWSLGCLMYILLSGQPPFKGNNKEEIGHSVMNTEPAFNTAEWRKISAEAKDFIETCLEKQSQNRPSINKLLDHQWINKMVKGPVVDSEIQLGIAASLIAFRKANLLQSGVISFLTNLLATTEDLHDYVEMFEVMDTSKDGFLSIDELKVGIQSQMGSFYFKRTDWDEVLLSMDTDGNGRIDFTEFITAAYDRRKLLCRENLKIAFEMFDLDGNGQITKEELRQVFSGGSQSALLQRFERVWSKILEEVDTDGNQEINFEEFAVAMEKMLLQQATFMKKRTLNNQN